ncbi:ABC transporter ATP-binding protein [Natronocalculus amylovorans]|uniref:ABC transporter ATP-binding protein n=1 Tax=Natronocalculus amylovorans TaxID=2917812 RepID=A0AAE3FYX4_9EURY|nr:ABC transporter ATP-binding protein [Natronocalculus amylovorans]MCL9817608.1 ABC transporter ATP-binding protein [Natronocalculus amylovorans]
MIAIETNGLTKQYGESVALSDLSVTIPTGTVYGFLGPNGAGKTTTMRILATLLKPTHGTAHIMGASIENRSAVAKHIGYLPETPPLYDELTGREQLEYIAGLREIPIEKATERIDRLATALSLIDDLDDRISSYSKGMKQKAAFIQAQLHDPAVLFLDEPTSGLDPRAARTMRTMIDDLAASGKTVFLSTHILPVVEEHADVVGVLNEGRLVAEGEPMALVQSAESGDKQSLEDVFLSITREPPGGMERAAPEPQHE